MKLFSRNKIRFENKLISWHKFTYSLYVMGTIVFESQFPSESQSPEMQTLPSISSFWITENFHNLDAEGAEVVLIFHTWLKQINQKRSTSDDWLIQYEAEKTIVSLTEKWSYRLLMWNFWELKTLQIFLSGITRVEEKWYTTNELSQIMINSYQFKWQD